MIGHEVLKWDVLDGGVLGAVIRCPECPCRDGTGCDGAGRLHRPYRLPGGAHIDAWGDADLLMPLLDRGQDRRSVGPQDPPPAP